MAVSLGCGSRVIRLGVRVNGVSGEALFAGVEGDGGTELGRPRGGHGWVPEAAARRTEVAGAREDGCSDDDDDLGGDRETARSGREQTSTRGSHELCVAFLAYRGVKHAH
jgi:hypothetical protein